MRRRLVASAAATLALLAGSVGTAFAVGGPNQAGNSGHFKVKSNPCQADADHPKCPGKH
jgi:hypothetical protein